MKVGYGLTLEQTQKLIMTPELRQAITVLQLTSLELTEYIDQQLETNPFLEIVEEDNGEKVNSGKDEERFDIDWKEYFQDRSDLGFVNYKDKDEQEYSYENYLSTTPTLQEHLISQLSFYTTNQRDYKIGEFIIGSLDSNGYLKIDTKQISEILKVSQHSVESVLKLIQAMDPIGVGARSIEECLLIQIENNNPNIPFLKEVVANNLKDIGDGRYTKIAEQYGISLKNVQDICDYIKKLEPKPGRNYRDSEVRYVVPDVTVEKVSGEYIVIVNDSLTPRLSINPVYKDILNKKDSKEANQFLNDRLDSALWLIKSIEQRRMTLYKVVKTIVDLQKDFLDKGIMYLKTMTLKEVAEIVGVHESTVSRATSGKYAQTPRGVFELKYFFSSGVSDNRGMGTSSESIKKIIGDLIKNEDPYHPLSDQKIAEIIERGGIGISRRTVAKYRDEMGIQSSNKRKRYK